MGTNEYGIDLKVVTNLAKELIELKNQLTNMCCYWRWEYF